MQNNHNIEDEVDLVALLKTIWQEKKTIVRFVTIFGLIGLFIAVFSEKEYTASTTLVPQMSEGNSSKRFGGLAALAGINIVGGNSESIQPSLYPEIVQSVPFNKELLKASLNFSHIKGSITYREYYDEYKQINLISVLKDYTVGLPGKIISLFKSKEENITSAEQDAIYRISKEEDGFFKQIKEQLVINNNIEDGFIKISYSMPEALAAAQMTRKAQELLQKAITRFKTQKTIEEFKFIEERHLELKKDFEKKQDALAIFRDRNQGLVTSRSQSRLEKLKSEYNLAYNIYSELAIQLETQKIKLKENTPAFTIIKPVSVPVLKMKPRRLLILVIWLFLGVFSSIAYVLFKKWIKDLKSKM